MARLRVLLVEDSDLDAEIAGRALHRAGVSFDMKRVEIEATLRRECVDFAPDIVLSDFALPQFDGMLALRIVRELLPDVPFIFVSGTIGEERAVASLHAGATDYVSKSNLLRLSSAVQRAVQEAMERTARRAAELRTLRSERVFRSFMENLPGLAFMKDEAGCFTFLSRNAEEILGHLPDRIVGVSPQALSSIPALAALRADDDKVRDANEVIQSTQMIPTPSGDRQWMVVKFPLRHADEAAGIGGIAMDITDRLQTEEALRLRDRAVEASMNPVLIVSATDPAMPIVYVNRAFERVTGYGRSEVIGRNCRLLQRDDDQQPDLDKIRRAIAEQCDGEALLRNYRKDGSLFWNRLHVTPVRDPSSGLVTHFVGVQHDITELVQYQDELERRAQYDALTALPNRNLLKDRLHQALAIAHRTGRRFAVAFIDLDNFKLINDSLGHGVGDDVLKIVGARLSKCVREGDTVARLGGDEFVLLSTEQTKGGDIYRVVPRVMTEIAKPFLIDGREFKVTCSVGVASFPEDGADAETLLRNADAAMYEAKGVGRDKFRLYSPDMNANIAARLTLETDLWHAVERGELVLHYQPKVSLTSGRIVGMEALLRWAHPELGLLEPASIIPIAEESGLILQIGRWTIATACEQNRAWQSAGIAPMPIAVNLSTRQLHDSDIVRVVADALAATGLRPEHLELEVTESAAMRNAEDAIRALSDIRAMGVRISLDDFGTGYSSLSYLKQLPVTGLKIDQSFIRDLSDTSDDAAIVRAVIAVAEALGHEVTAEGVETAEQVALLTSYRATAAQGYYFSRPVPADAAARFLERGTFPLS